MVKLQLGGHLRRFGRRYELEVRDAAEAVRCLCYQLKGFQQAISDGLIRVRIAGRDMTEKSIPVGMNHPLNDGDTITIVPVVGGAGGNGVGMAILGVVAVAAAFWTGGGSLAAWASASGAAATAATGLAIAGVALISAGLASMLTKMPKGPEMGSSKTDGNQYFNSLENRIGQGYPVPIAYGEMVVGSNVISQGLETE